MPTSPTSPILYSSEARRPFRFPEPDPFFSTHDFETALRNTITPQPVSCFKFYEPFKNLPKRRVSGSIDTTKLAVDSSFEIFSDPVEEPVAPRTYTPRRRPLAPREPESEDALRPLRRERHLALAQEEARALAMRAQAAADAMEIFEDENDDKDWNKENEEDWSRQAQR